MIATVPAAHKLFYKFVYNFIHLYILIKNEILITSNQRDFTSWEVDNALDLTGANRDGVIETGNVLNLKYNASHYKLNHTLNKKRVLANLDRFTGVLLYNFL